MPRLLPRLVSEIEKRQDQYFPFTTKRKRRKSLYRPHLPSPIFHQSHYERSILLATQSPVANPKAFIRHKRLPPIMTRPRQSEEDDDTQRQMSDEEFRWWSNPYLRMLAAPLRTCVVTHRTVPTDLLIRLVPMRIPPADDATQSNKKLSSPVVTLVPDGVLHNKYFSRKLGGSAVHVLCWRKAVQLLHPGSHRRISGKIVFPSSLSDYIAHLLRLRVLQELELLTERLEYAMRSGKNLGNPACILRRLSYIEWGTLKSTGTIPYQNAVAVLVVPQPNRHPVTKERPVPSMSASPPDDEEYPESVPPLSELMSNSDTALHDETGSLPHLEIPVYNSITAFPSRSQRAALYQFLTRILAVERFLKRLHLKKANFKPDTCEPENGQGSPARKGSHAFMLCSDNKTIQRGDSAAVALALWRLRMYEGDGWIPSIN